MAEELGHIDIRFPSTPGGGAGDTTGPLPTKLALPNMSANIATTMRAAMGDFAAIAKTVVDNVIGLVSSIKDFVSSVVSDIRERGKFSPDVLMENVASQIQNLSNQFQEAKVLGPLYAMVLKWYRELMQLLQPWKLLFQTIASFLAGAILASLTKLMELVNKGLDGLLGGISSILRSISVLAAMLASPGAIEGAVGASIAGLLGNVAQTGMFAAEVSKILPDTGLAELVGKIAELADLTGASIDQLRQINRNTKPPPGKGLDWVGAQLREIASRAPTYSGRKHYGYWPFYLQPGTNSTGRLGRGYP